MILGFIFDSAAAVGALFYSPTTMYDRSDYMSFVRTERINGEMMRELASIFRTIKDPRMSEFTSVVSVRVTKDLKYAKIYVSVMGDDEKKKDTMTWGLIV